MNNIFKKSYTNNRSNTAGW